MNRELPSSTSPKQGMRFKMPRSTWGSPHHRPARRALEGSLHLEEGPQEEDGETAGKDVEGCANDELVASELHHKEGEKQTH